MVLVHAWRRRLYGSVAAVAFAPAVLLVALLALALTGGFARLGVLSQAFAGPSAPRQSSSAGTRLLPAPVLTALAATGRSSVAHVPVGRVLIRTHTPKATPRTRSPVGSVPPPRSSTRPGRSGGPGRGRSPHPHKPTPVDRIVSAATKVTSQLPPPVGPTATQALQSLGSTVDKILPPVPHVPR